MLENKEWKGCCVKAVYFYQARFGSYACGTWIGKVALMNTPAIRQRLSRAYRKLTTGDLREVLYSFLNYKKEEAKTRKRNWAKTETQRERRKAYMRNCRSMNPGRNTLIKFIVSSGLGNALIEYDKYNNNLRAQAYKRNNPEKVKESKHAWRRNLTLINKQKIYRKEYREKNKEEILIRAKEYRFKNKEKINLSRRIKRDRERKERAFFKSAEIAKELGGL